MPGDERKDAPWWLEPWEELCEFCLGSYHFEAGYYCAECDSPVCPVCVVEVRASRTLLCPQCYQGEA